MVFDTYFNKWLLVSPECNKINYDDVNGKRQEICAFSLFDVNENMYYQYTRFHIDRIKRYYPNLISDKQIDFSIISQDNTSGVSDYHQYIRIDYSKLKLQQETIITENVCPTCKYDCSVYKCSRLHTNCEL